METPGIQPTQVTVELLLKALNRIAQKNAENEEDSRAKAISLVKAVRRFFDFYLDFIYRINLKKMKWWLGV